MNKNESRCTSEEVTTLPVTPEQPRNGGRNTEAED